MEFFSEILKANRSAVLDYAAAFSADTELIIHHLLDENIYTYDRDLYSLTEPGSFMLRYNTILHEEDDDLLVEGLRSLHEQYPYYNRPLRHLLEDDAVDGGIAEDVLSSSMRWDYFPESRSTLRIILAWRSVYPHREDFPFSSLDDDAAASETFMHAGDVYAGRGDMRRAYSCLENACLFAGAQADAAFRQMQDKIRAYGEKVPGDYAAYLDALR